jgi:hypothetical protein
MEIGKMYDNGKSLVENTAFHISDFIENEEKDFQEELLQTQNFEGKFLRIDEKSDNFLDNLLAKFDISLLEEYDEYILVNLIKLYIFSEEYPENSNLYMSYHLFCTDLELLVCLKLAEKLPEYNYIQNQKERNLLQNNHKYVSERVRLFLVKWSETHQFKKVKVHDIVKNNSLQKEESVSFIEISTLLMEDPSLPNKLLSNWKLLVEGIFYFDIEEITRQICLIDHKNLRNAFRRGFKNLWKYNESVPQIQNIFLREKQLTCYILISILNQSTLGNIKIIVNNFISLASNLRKVKNYQTCFTVISCFYNTKLQEKKIIWNMIEQKQKDVYINMEKDYLDYYIKDFVIEPNTKRNYIPNIHNICFLMHKFISQVKSTPPQGLLLISNDFKDFNIAISEILNSKLGFFKVNPLYIFMKYGFLEIFNSKKWNLKTKLDFTTMDNLEANQKYTVLLEILSEKFEKAFNS